MHLRVSTEGCYRCTIFLCITKFSWFWQVMDVDHVKQKVKVLLIPRLDLQALAAKFQVWQDDPGHLLANGVSSVRFYCSKLC